MLDPENYGPVKLRSLWLRELIQMRRYPPQRREAVVVCFLLGCAHHRRPSLYIGGGGQFRTLEVCSRWYVIHAPCLSKPHDSRHLWRPFVGIRKETIYCARLKKPMKRSQRQLFFDFPLFLCLFRFCLYLLLFH